jgi:hypothetical protein
MLDIPAVVQKVGFRAHIAVGIILGKYDKFKDGPEPAPERPAGSRPVTLAA